jgi:hypothetical protein
LVMVAALRMKVMEALQQKVVEEVKEWQAM